MECYQCYKQCEEVYKVKVIDEIGKMSFERTCSEECALEVQEEMYELHKNRAEEVNNQIIQRLK